jgi:hypothetical protein
MRHCKEEGFAAKVKTGSRDHERPESERLLLMLVSRIKTRRSPPREARRWMAKSVRIKV